MQLAWLKLAGTEAKKFLGTKNKELFPCKIPFHWKKVQTESLGEPLEADLIT